MRTYEELSTTEKIREWIAKMRYAQHLAELACTGLPDVGEVALRRYDQAKAEQYVCENHIDLLLKQLDRENQDE